MIGRGLAMPTRAGRGYLKRGNEIVEFQSGYAGLLVRSEMSTQAEEFTIYQVEADGSYQQFYTHTKLPGENYKKGDTRIALKEEELIVSLLRQAADELHIKPAPKIYLQPLPEQIPLEQVLSEAGTQPKFMAGQWQNLPFTNRLLAPLGVLDMPRERRQELLIVDFEDQDGHLWIIGAPGSGKELVMASLLLSLAQTYSPEEVQFYILELGGGDLKQFESLPHTGSVIRPLVEEKERLERLLNFLENEMSRRTAGNINSDDERSSMPFLFLIINNFADLRSNFPDESERLARFVRDGRRARIHLIITTNRGIELTMSLRNNIARRMVLQLGSKDEHFDLIGRDYPLLNAKIEGRGYWVDGVSYVCQVGESSMRPRELIPVLNTSWQGKRPAGIKILPTSLKYDDFMRQFTSTPEVKRALIVVGQSYETLEPVAPDLEESSRTWLVLGPKESGKSNFLACMARSALATAPTGIWDIRVYALRRSPLSELGQANPLVKVFSNPDEIIADLQAQTTAMRSGSLPKESRTLYMIDDLGAAFQLGKENIANALNLFASQMENAPGQYLVAAGLLDELRMFLGTPILKLLKQSRMGMVFSKDNAELDWLGGQISMAYRRMELPTGRGFFVNRGKPVLIQTLLAVEQVKSQ